MIGRDIKADLKNRAYKFSVGVIIFIEEVTQERKIYYSLVDQLIRSSTSIGANIVEAKSASSRKDYIRYFEIALKSANETKYWLCLFRDAIKCDKKKTENLIKEADEISKMIASSILTMKGKRKI
ncbi:MAG: four helix bundle protein [Bacteroidales bacterium]|jgi:four helix bundle protein|nr:four helix bundle protein [Bacteroidales bacterium]